MYTRQNAKPTPQQPSYGYPRAYPPPQGQGYPQYPQQPGYPPPQQQSHGYPQQGYPSFAPGYPPQQQPQQQQYPPRGPGAIMPTGPPPPQQPAAPYGARPAIPPAPSAYEMQSAKWKNGFKTGGGSTAGASSARHTDSEAPLVNELCSSAGSSYPPRELVQKLLRHLPSLDHQYLCELLDNKLEDRVWQVQGKALSVLDALFKSSEGDFFKEYYYYRSHVLDALCHSKKDLLRARAEKVAAVVKTFVPPDDGNDGPSDDGGHEQQQIPPSREEEPSLLLPMSPIIASGVGSPNLMPSLDMPPQALEYAAQQATSAPASTSAAAPGSAFSFLTSGTTGATPTPAPAVQPPVSAFSFLSGPTVPPQPAAVAAPTPAPIARTHAAPPVDVFSSLPPPTPIIGRVILQEPTPPTPTKVEEEDDEDHVVDHIHDAFEGLDMEDTDDQDGNDDANPLEGFSTTNSGSMMTGSTTTTIKLDPNDPLREFFLEVDVPAGPMGLVLDRSIPHMAIVERFIPLPSGARGYLEMHPALCPGCQLVSVNAMSVEDKGLDEVGAVLGSLIGSYKILRFKKLMRNGRIANPANPEIAYMPPPLERPPSKEQEEVEEDEEDDDDHEGEAAEDTFTPRLEMYSAQLDGVERELESLIERDRANVPIVDMRNQLAQLHGHVEKIQTQGIDAVILGGAHPPRNVDAIKQLRSSLVRRADALTKRIQKIATNGTAPSPAMTATASPTAASQPTAVHVATAAAPIVGSPEVSAFSFVGGAGGTMAPPPPLVLPETVTKRASIIGGAAPASAFSFLHGNPITSPTSSSATAAAPPASASAASMSAFSFMQSGATTATAPMAPAPVFAGLSIRDRATPPVVSDDVAPTSAFGFLSANGMSTQQPPAGPPPTSVTSPTAFSFLRGGTGRSSFVASPQSSPSAAANVAAQTGSSAFSFIS